MLFRSDESVAADNGVPDDVVAPLLVEGGLSLSSTVAERSTALASQFGAHVRDASFVGKALPSYPYKVPGRYNVKVAALPDEQRHLARAPGTYQVVCLRCSKNYSVAPSLQCVKTHPFAKRCNQCLSKRSRVCEMVSFVPLLRPTSRLLTSLPDSLLRPRTAL